MGSTKSDSFTPKWASYSDEDLLKLRICDLGLQVDGTELEARVEQLYQELEDKGLKIRPLIYLGDEWFSPEGLVAIAIPFYLAHPRLKALEKSMVLEIEGGTADWCMKLLRHEAGHCVDHAFRLSKKFTWRKIFGPPGRDYDPDTYQPRPYSHSYVRHLDNWYAQSHPDEDFAETFAVWLDPDSNWSQKYQKWKGALKKLQYLDKTLGPLSGKEVKVLKARLPYHVSRMKKTLGAYYKKKKRDYQEELPDFYDPDLVKIFNGKPDLSKREFGAARFLSRNRKLIIHTVGAWSHARKYLIHDLLKDLIYRCEELDLRLGKGEAETNLEVASYLATMVTTYFFTGKFKRSV